MRTNPWVRPHPKIWFLGAAILSLALLLPSPVHANSIPYRLYTISDGLPHENIQTLEQTPDGRLWVGTSAGLSFYTGLGFVPVRFLDAGSTVNILEIEPLGNDDVWVATHQLGVWQVRYQHAVQPFPELARVRASRLIARNDTLFVYAQKEVWRISLDAETIERTPYQMTPPGPDAEFIGIQQPEIVSEDFGPNGDQWVLDKRRGPGRLFADGTIQFINDSVDDGWYAIQFDDRGTAWVTHEKDGLFRFDPSIGEMELVISEVGVRHICVTPTMVVVTSYNHGALYWSLMEDRQLPSLNESSGLPTNRVNCMYRDHEGNGWVGTQIGLIHLSHPGVQHMMEIDHRPLLNLNAVLDDRDHSLWASSFSEGLFRLDPEPRAVLPMGENRWTDLIKGQDGRLHALGGSGWFVYESNRTSAEDDSNGSWVQVQSYAEGYNGDVGKNGIGYFWHTSGVYRHRPGWPASPVYLWPVEEQDYHHQTLSQDGRLLIWANGRLLEVQLDAAAGGQYEAKVIREAPEFSNTTVRDMVVDQHGRAWVALLSTGLLCVDADTTIQLLPGYHIEKLTLEGDSLLIANAREGLFVFNLPDKNAAKEQRKKAPAPGVHLRPDAALRYQLTQSDGLMSSTVSGAVFTKDFLWTTHPGGVSKIPRRLLNHEPPIPQVLLTSINYNGIARSPYRDVVLKATDRNIGFEFSATTFSHAHRVQYRYRLKGFNNRWNETQKPFVQFAKLPAGTYEFEVQAATSNRAYGEPVSYDFVIPEPYYQRPVFWMAILILLTAVTYWLHMYRLRSMLQVERTRTQIAMDLHDDIGSSLTSLSFMSSLAIQRTEDQTPGEEISPLLKEIGSMSSELVDNMLDIVWSVDPKQDSVGSIISRLQAFFQRLHAASEISVEWKVEESVRRIALPPRSRRNLYLILKEAINNAIKHSDTTKIDVVMTHDLAVLHVVIQDYGHGFDVDETAGGYGLSTMKDRAEESGATFELRSSVDSSTTVYVRWPLRKYPLSR